MITSIIGAGIIAVGVFIHWLFSQVNDVNRENQILKAKEVTHDAEKIVAAKTDAQLVDDFNSRYKPDDSGGGPS